MTQHRTDTTPPPGRRDPRHNSITREGGRTDMDRLTGGGPPGRTDSSGALEAMAGGPCGRGVVPRPGYYSRTSTTKSPPPKTKNPWGRCRGIRSPPGLNTETRQPTGTGSPPWARLGCWGPRSCHSGHDMKSGALTVSLSNCFHLHERRGKRLVLASVAIPRSALPVPDDSPWTRQDSLKLFPWAQQVLKSMSLDNTEWHSWPWLGNWIPGCWSEPQLGGLSQRWPTWVSRGRRHAWVSHGRQAWGSRRLRRACHMHS